MPDYQEKMMRLSLEVLAYFYIYAFVGWVCEDIYVGILNRKLVNRGMLNGPYCPIYGFGALLVFYPLEEVKNSALAVFLSAIVITTTLEYLSSWALEKLFHTRWWDYSHLHFNLNGRVCLLNSLLFGLMGLAGIYFVHPFVSSFVEGIGFYRLFWILLIISILFIIDLVMTIYKLMKRNQIMEKASLKLASVKEKYELEKEESKQELKEKYDAWLKKQDDEEIVSMIEKLDRLRNSRLAKAFPNRKIQDNLTSLKEYYESILNNN